MSVRGPRLLAVAAALVVAGCGTSTGTPAPASAPPSVAASAPASPPASVPPPSAAAGDPCTPDVVTATTGGWEGAAGSRGADVTVSASSPCRLPASPVVRVVDAHGTVLAASAPRSAGTAPETGPGATTSFSMLFSNWCSPSGGLPVTVVLGLEGGSVPIDGATIRSAAELPPCNGPGQPMTITTTDWQPG